MCIELELASQLRRSREEKQKSEAEELRVCERKTTLIPMPQRQASKIELARYLEAEELRVCERLRTYIKATLARQSKCCCSGQTDDGYTSADAALAVDIETKNEQKKVEPKGAICVQLTDES